MLKFYFNAAPNPMKVALFLEEAGLDYEPVPVDTKTGAQHSDWFRAINPNAKLPAIQDGDATVFDSNAILLYLAEKTGQFLPPGGDAERAALLSWLMFIASGVGPYSGQAVHFRNFAPEDIPYAKKRYGYEARRHWGIVNDRLAERDWMLGDTYTIVDMAIWGWAPRIPFMIGDDAMEGFPHIARLMAAIDARPAADRARALPQAHTFKQEMDEVAMRAMYPQIFAED
ncbi:glutathione S-transferase family protein [Rhodobacteraceae bacterium CCMM004]|nr:glutathione S-transferase family protein [Rhodobacteraceae bacterium CCMM004]